MKKYRFIFLFCFAFIGLLVLLTIRNDHPTNIDNRRDLSLLPTPTPSVTLASFLTSSPSKIVGWKTYTNMSQGYSVDVPDDYVADLLSIRYDDGTPEIGFCSNKNAKSWDLQTDELCFSLACPSSKYQSLRSYIRAGELRDSGIVAQNVSWTTINGKEVAREKMGNSYAYYYFFNKGLVCTILPENNQSSLNDKMFNKILSTFKFTENTTVSLEESIKKSLGNSRSLSVTIKTQDGSFAFGDFNEVSDENSGGKWIAKKTSNLWQVLESGPFSPSCKILTENNVPITIVSSCMDGVWQKRY